MTAESLKTTSNFLQAFERLAQYITDKFMRDNAGVLPVAIKCSNCGHDAKLRLDVVNVLYECEHCEHCASAMWYMPLVAVEAHRKQVISQPETA